MKEKVKQKLPLPEMPVGGTPQTMPVPASISDPFDHPDALSRFRVMGDMDELLRALEYPWEKWTVFLHPEQRRFVTGNYSGLGRVSGSAGTGKTVVALHRAIHLAKMNTEARILLATFSEILANPLKSKLRMLIQNQPRLGDQIEVNAMNTLGECLYSLNLGKAHIASPDTFQALLSESAAKVSGHSFSLTLLKVHPDTSEDPEDWESVFFDRSLIDIVAVWVGKDIAFISMPPNGLRYWRWGRRGQCLGAGKTRSQKNG